MKENEKNKNPTPKKIINKKDLVLSVSTLSGLSRTNSSLALEGLLTAIKAGLKKEGEVKIAGFGVFHVMHRKEGTGRNPRTGEPLKIKAAKIPKFRAGSPLRKAIA